ncbi:hypothetical protein SACC_12110 [Saccharolobus caldissimus]|uniref:Uncharacterized protein n=1 Tax=Saccharolobus caldissimus TaxID=1702097 RepID=A0AAQ4CQW3_9CREN|nr:hypothetical protein SACC_12110 [Saccharolobus caldissimus]
MNKKLTQKTSITSRIYRRSYYIRRVCLIKTKMSEVDNVKEV